MSLGEIYKPLNYSEDDVKKHEVERIKEIVDKNPVEAVLRGVGFEVIGRWPKIGFEFCRIFEHVDENGRSVSDILLILV